VVSGTATLKAHQARAPLAERLAAVPAGVWLGALVAVSCAARFGAAWKHALPRLFPDEYIYEQLANGIAHGRLTIRGQSAHFPALLEPLLASPFWLFSNVELAFRLTQAMHAVVGSLVAVPVYLLARRVALPAWQALSCSALALLLPGLVFSAYVSADAVGLTFAVSAIYLGVRAVGRTTVRSQLAFLVVGGLATFARVQYVIVFAAFLAAALLASGGRPLQTLARYRVTVVALCLPVAGMFAVGAGRALGYYHDVLNLHPNWGIARWAASDAMLFVYSCGYVLVPLALVGLVLGLVRPAVPEERVLAGFVGTFALLLLAEASLYAANGSGRFQERYVMALQPFVPILFCLAVSRRLERNTRLAALAFSIGFIVVAARVPLSGYAVFLGSQDSPFLQCFLQLMHLTSTGWGSLIIALAVLLLTGPALLAVTGRPGVTAALATTAAVLAALTVGATVTDVQAAQGTGDLQPRDAQFVDHSGLKNVAVLVTPSTFRPMVSGHLFWNRSLTRVLQMREGYDLVDAFSHDRVRVLRDGTILAGGRYVTGPLLVEEYADAVTLDNAKLVLRDVGASLWQPRGRARLETLTYGWYFDGWLSARSATVTVWPHATRPRTGVLCLDLSLPGSLRRTVHLKAPGFARSVEVDRLGAHIVVPVDTKKARWTLHVTPDTTKVPLSDSGRIVSAHSARPRFVEISPGSAQDPATACR
jgi:hypothetical protein